MFDNEINLNIVFKEKTMFSTIQKGYLFKCWPYIKKVTFLI